MSKGAPDSSRYPTTAEEWWVLLADEAPLEQPLADAFRRWRSEPANAAAYEEVAAAWEAMDAGLGDPQLRQWLEEAEAPAPRSRRWARLRGWAGAAAVLAVLLAAVPAVMWLRPGPAPEQVETVWEPFATVRGEVREVALADGSIMHLDTATRTRVSLQGSDQRLIHLLEGRIRIDVGADPRPLRVHAGPLRIDHIGTVFDVSWNDGAGEVLLRDGALQVHAAGRSQAMAPGDRLLVDGDVWRLERLPADALAGSAAWVTGRVEFDDRPLVEVARVLSTYGPRDVHVDPRDPAADLRVSGVFQAGRQQEFLDALSHVYPVILREDGEDEVELQLRD